MGPSSPLQKTSLLFELTSRCNAKCSFCYNSARGIDQLATTSALTLIDKAVDEIGPYHVSFSGGEPLLHPGLPELVRHAKDKGLKTTVVTNAILMTGDKARLLLDCGVDLFQVTLLSADQNLHDRLEGGPFFKKVVSAIADLVNTGAQVATSFVACRENIGTFERTLELNVLLRVRQVQFCRFNPGGLGLPGLRRLMPTPDEVETALHCAAQVASRYPLSVFASVPIMPCLVDYHDLKGVSVGFCAVGDPEYPVLAFDSTGNLKVCPHSGVSLGNALEKPIPEILRGEAYAEFLESIPPFCADCPHASACRGGCRSAAYICSGSSRHEDPFLSLWKERAVVRRSSPDFASLPIGRRPCSV